MSRFLPNKRASIDQAPGPSIAKAAAMAAKTACPQGSPHPENADQNAKTESAPPAIGVQRPAQSNSTAGPSIAILENVGADANPVTA